MTDALINEVPVTNKIAYDEFHGLVDTGDLIFKSKEFKPIYPVDLSFGQRGASGTI